MKYQMDRNDTDNQQHSTLRSNQRDPVEDCVEVSESSFSHISQSQDVLSDFEERLHGCGFAGDTKQAKLLYLALTTRVFDGPVSVVVKGPSAGGKSYLLESVLKFFPSDAYEALSSMSERAIIYWDADLRHRFLVLYEAAGLQSKFAEYLIRSLLSEGRVAYVTTQKGDDGKFVARHITRDGPTGLILTTTKPSIHSENETRMISITVDDSPEQLRAVMLAQASGVKPSRDKEELADWQAFQQKLAEADEGIDVPFAVALADMVPSVSLRLKRDFPHVLALIMAHALIHKAHRDRNDDGQVIATLDDYEAVWHLISDVVAEGIEAAVPEQVRETVQAVSECLKEAPHAIQQEGREIENGVRAIDVAKKLGLDKSTATRRVREARRRGYLRNLETRRFQTGRWVPGDPLPEDQTVLPTPAALRAKLEGRTN